MTTEPHTPASGARQRPAPAPAAPPVPAHRDGTVLRWLTAYTATMIGDGVYFLALGWAAQRTTSPAGVGVVMAAGAVPRALLLLGGGVLADRFGPRPVLLGSDAVRCVVVLGAAAVLLLSGPSLGLLLAVALVFGLVDALFLPAVGALPARLTDPGQLARVQGMKGLAVRAGNVTGPPLGGLALAYGDLPLAFACAGGLFTLSLALLLTVRVRPPAHGVPWPRTEGPLRGQLTGGLRYLARHPLLARLTLGNALSELALIGPLNVGLVLLAAERGWGAAGVGWMVSAFGAGAAVSTLLLAVRGRVPRAGAVQIGAMAAASLSLGTLGLSPGLGGAMASAGLAGVAGGLAGAVSRSLVQTTADPAQLGRVTAVTDLTTLGLAPLTYPLFAAAAALWGTPQVFAASGVLGLTGTAITVTARAVRGAELPPPTRATA